MKNKRVILWFLKAIGAGLFAFVILNIFCFFYYNIPTHRLADTHPTEYRWEANKFYSRGTEGFAGGVTDANGYNNLKTFEDGEIDILVMGSSHMEGFNVAQDKNTTAVLNSLFADAGIDMNAYNIGVSGHTLLRCFNNLEAAIKEFNPRKFIVIEAQIINPSSSSLKQAHENTLKPLKKESGRITRMLSGVPYLRLLFAQLNGNDDATEEEEVDIDRRQLLDDMVRRSARFCEEAGVKLIIVYNREISIDKKGNVEAINDQESVDLIKSICDNNGVIFVDMYEPFKTNYEKTYILPRGFSNTEAGKGHLNESGHRVMAEKLFAVMRDQ